MIIENEHEIHFNGIAMEKVVERSLQTKNSRMRNVEKQMEIKLQQLHIQRKMWRGHNIMHFVGLFILLMMEKMLKG